MPGLKPRAKNLLELAENAKFYFAVRPLDLDDKAAKLLDADGRAAVAEALAALESVVDWRADLLEARIAELAERLGLKLGKIAQPLRAALTGSAVSPGIFDV